MANYLLWWLFLLPCRRCNCFWRLCSLHFNTASLSGGYPTCIHRFNQRLLVSVRLLPRDSIQYYNLLWRRCLPPSRYFSVLFLVHLSTARYFLVLFLVVSVQLGYFWTTIGTSQYYFWYVSALLSTSQYYFWYVSGLLGTFQYYFWYFQPQHYSVLLSLSTIFCTSQHWALGLCLRRRCGSGVRIEKTTIGTSQYYFWYVSALLHTSQYYFLCVSALLGTSEY